VYLLAMDHSNLTFSISSHFCPTPGQPANRPIAAGILVDRREDFPDDTKEQSSTTAAGHHFHAPRGIVALILRAADPTPETHR
jgi:hypothetical protein